MRLKVRSLSLIEIIIAVGILGLIGSALASFVPGMFQGLRPANQEVELVSQQRDLEGSEGDVAPIKTISLPVAWLEPAQLYIVSLSQLGLSTDVRVTGVSGGALEAMVLDGTLRFATQGDSGIEVPGSILLTDGLEDKVIEFRVLPGRPTVGDSHRDYDEDEDALPDELPLEVVGLGPGNVLRPTDLVFRIGVNAPAKGEFIAQGFLRDTEGTTVGLDTLWIYDPSSVAYTVPAAAMAGLISSLSPGDVEIFVSFFSADFSSAGNYAFLTLNPAATIKGRVVDNNGQPLLNLSDRKILVRGSLTNIRRVVTIDENGSFEVPDVVPETYYLELLDLQNPLSVSTTLSVYPSSKVVEVDLVVHTNPL